MPPDSTRLVVLEDCIIMFYSDSDRNHLASTKESSASLEAEAEIQKTFKSKDCAKAVYATTRIRREYNMRSESSVRDYAHPDVNTT